MEEKLEIMNDVREAAGKNHRLRKPTVNIVEKYLVVYKFQKDIWKKLQVKS